MIKDPVDAWDFDNAVTLRLLHFDNERDVSRMKFQAQLISYEVSKMFGGETNDEIEGIGQPVSSLTANDPYADENTVIL